MGTAFATQAQKTMGQNAAFEKGIEVIFDEFGQARSGLSFDLGDEGLEVFLYPRVEGCLFRAPPLVVNLVFSRGSLNRLAHDL